MTRLGNCVSRDLNLRLFLPPLLSFYFRNEPTQPQSKIVFDQGNWASAISPPTPDKLLPALAAQSGSLLARAKGAQVRALDSRLRETERDTFAIANAIAPYRGSSRGSAQRPLGWK
jgi:hypothetical protein